VSLPADSARVNFLQKLRLCYVTDRHSFAETASAKSRAVLLDKIESGSSAGIDWIQIREKDLTGNECSALTRQALQRVASTATGEGSRTRIVVNDRLDVALAARAGGVHLGEYSLPPQEAKRLIQERQREEDFLIGVSCHSLPSAKIAAENGADYIFFGPVFATPSKAAYGAPQGLERLAEVCRTVSIPVLAIGGITLDNFAACASAGASGIAAIRLFQDADVAAVVQALRKIML